MISFSLDNFEKFVVGPNFFGHADGCELMLLGGIDADFRHANPREIFGLYFYFFMMVYH